MEKVLGIIAEYNPFHNGHLYHLTESKKILNANATVAIVGNNFTQRGDVSLVDKWTKAKIALSNGIDLVIELPTIYSISSAENFAYGAISILDSLNIVDFLSFGSESGNIDEFKEVLDLTDESKQDSNFSKILKEELSKGISFPKAKSNALSKISPKYDNFLTPNNILGLEYTSCLKKIKSNISPFTIKRNVSDYNDKALSKLKITSATSIREILTSSNNKNENCLELCKNYLSPETFKILYGFKKKNEIFPSLKDFEKEIIYILKRLSLDEIKNLPDVYEGLENKIKKAANISSSAEELILNIKSKRYTVSRIQRILLCALLGITKDDLELSKNITPYIRVLGFSKKGKELLSRIAKNKDLNIITSVKTFENNLNNESLKRLLEIDMFSTNVYNQVLKNKNNNDYTGKILEI